MLPGQWGKKIFLRTHTDTIMSKYSIRSNGPVFKKVLSKTIEVSRVIVYGIVVVSIVKVSK